MEKEVIKESSDKNSCQGAEVEQEYIIFENDQQYLDEYVQIYMLLMERHSLLETIQEGKPGSRGRPHRDESEKEDAKEKLPELTKAIEVKEWLFWEKVDKSQQAGYSFVIEEVARYYNLGHLEKRIVLLLLCGEVFGEIRLPLTSISIVNMLSFNNSFSEKIKNVMYFDKDRALLRNKLIYAAYMHYPPAYRLSLAFLDFLSKRINGEQAPWPKVTIEQAQPEVDQAGFIKTAEHSMDKVVLNEELKEKVRFFIEIYTDKKFQELEVDKTIKNSRGLTFLFYGPPGTGKSMLAEAIAHSLGKKILVVETPKIFDFLLGETDKNISSMFKRAKENDLVLLIDEVDSLVYTRDIASSDFKVRFVNVMLTELERFEGIAILTTNMDKILDAALERRIALKVQFELPSWERRVEIWKKHVPPALGLAGDVNFELLAKKYEFSGGNIKNAALTAIRRVFFRKEHILTMDDLIFGADLEKEGMFSYANKARCIRGFTT